MNYLIVRRLLAYFADCVILFFVLAPIGFLVQHLFDLMSVSQNEIYFTILLNFSIPVWIYFIISDSSKSGATLGKRFLGIKTVNQTGNRVSTRQAFFRTSIKMIPWELSHIAGFLLAPEPGLFNTASWSVISLVYLLVFIYLFVAWRNKGEKSIHDIPARTEVNFATKNR